MCYLRIITVLNAVERIVSKIKPKVVANTYNVMPPPPRINPDFEGARPVGYIITMLNISS